MQKPFYLTTTLPYVNADLHMGHALEFVRADIIVRYKKLQGYDVFFNTGTDEHGMKIYDKAASLGKTPQEFVDESFLRFKDSVKIFGLDDGVLHYIRTTDAHHEAAAQEFWKRCADNGYIYKKNYQAKYCSGCEEVKTDSELVNGRCPIHQDRELVLIDEENYFFKYSAFTEKLTAFYAENPNFVVPDFRYNEIKAFVARGLEDFSISRLATKMPWGESVPGDDKHVMYVWFDALTNYISTLGWPKEDGDFEKYWVNGTPTQYCGKDNLRFQSAMWQAMLMAAGVENSHQIVINGFITADGGIKMSKSLGNGVDPKDIVAEYGTEALRFFLAKEISSFEDSPFTIERFKASYNAHLANGLGNLVSRVLTMAENNNIKARAADLEIFDLPYKANPFFDAYQINNVINLIWSWISEADTLIQTGQPFKLIKTDFAKAEIEIKTLLQYLIQISYYLRPVMPQTAESIEKLVKANKKPEEPLFLRKD